MLQIAAHHADVLVHEATFVEEERERAAETGHSTARQAAQIAAEADVALLALVHLSGRYGGREVLEEALATFPRTVLPRDFDSIEVPFAEKGVPELVRFERPAPTPAPG
jgi:ribonuclease Z